jgi:hypothetical protein
MGKTAIKKAERAIADRTTPAFVTNTSTRIITIPMRSTWICALQNITSLSVPTDLTNAGSFIRWFADNAITMEALVAHPSSAI